MTTTDGLSTARQALTEALAKAADRGTPWVVQSYDWGHYVVATVPGTPRRPDVAKCDRVSDADLIVLMRNTLPALLARLEELEQERATSRKFETLRRKTELEHENARLRDAGGRPNAFATNRRRQLLE